MRLDPMRVQDLRTIVLIVIRLVALWLIAWGAFQIIARLAFGFLGAKKLDQAWSVWMDIGSEHGIYRGLGALAIGIPMAILSQALSRWIVRPPETSCPRCGYEGAGQPDGICNECGLTGWRTN